MWVRQIARWFRHMAHVRSCPEIGGSDMPVASTSSGPVVLDCAVDNARSEGCVHTAWEALCVYAVESRTSLSPPLMCSFHQYLACDTKTCPLWSAWCIFYVSLTWLTRSELLAGYCTKDKKVCV
eukprot:6458133-Amphidinium_carterae.1